MILDHWTTRALIIPDIISMIMERYGLSENEALDAFYNSTTAESLCDDETGLYGQSPLFIFGLYVAERENLDLY